MRVKLTLVEIDLDLFLLKLLRMRIIRVVTLVFLLVVNDHNLLGLVTGVTNDFFDHVYLVLGFSHQMTFLFYKVGLRLDYYWLVLVLWLLDYV